MSNKPTKPFILEFAEAKSKIISAINEAMHEHNIPCVLLEDILANALQQIKVAAMSEKNTMRSIYNKKLAEFEKNEVENTEEDVGGENDGLET